MTSGQYTVQIPWSIAASDYSLAVIGISNSHFKDFIAAVTLLRHRKSIRGRATLLLPTDTIQSSVQEWRRNATPSCIASNLRLFTFLINSFYKNCSSRDGSITLSCCRNARLRDQALCRSSGVRGSRLPGKEQRHSHGRAGTAWT